MKKDGLFDVTMGAYDGAEVCELVGTFLLDKISEKYEKNSNGLYRDDGLSVFKNKSGTQLERIKKNLQKTFKDFGLEIVAESNLKIVNYLDVTLNTELSKEYWDIKRNNFIPKVTWSIVRECPPYSLSKRKCYLCLNEKLEINSYKGNNLLNKRSELINKCRHLNKDTLLRHDTKD